MTIFLQYCSNLGRQHNMLQIRFHNQSKDKFQGLQPKMNSSIATFGTKFVCVCVLVTLG